MRKWRAPRDNDDNDADEDEDDDDADGDDNGDDEDDVHDAPFRPFFLPSFFPSFLRRTTRWENPETTRERRASQRGRLLAVSSCGILSAKCSYPGDSARG